MISSLQGLRAPLQSYLSSFLLLLTSTMIGRLLFYLFQIDTLPPLTTTELINAWLWGLRFDLALAALLTLLLYCSALIIAWSRRIDFQTVMRLGSALLALGLLMLHGSDLIYYQEAGRHLGYELREGGNSMVESFSHAFHSYPAMSWTHLLMGLLIALLGYRWLSRTPRIAPSPRPPLELALLVLLIPCVLIIRGGVEAVPLEPLHAQQIGGGVQSTIALNGSYNALYNTLSGKHIESLLPQPPTPQQLQQFMGLMPVHPQPSSTAKPQPHVVLLLLESWSGAYMQSYGYPEQTTPFFDGLRERSLTTRGMLAGGHRTTEGMFATLCSWQNPLGKTVAQTQLQEYSYRCLPQLLNEAGYTSVFVQGTNRNTSGVGAFAQLLGFQSSIGKQEINHSTLPHNSWGLHDADIYQQALTTLRQAKGPMLIGINTNTTHDHQLPPGITPQFGDQTQEARYKSVLHYADQALQQLITTIESDPTIGETLFVIVADHTGLSPDLPLAHYWVPFLIVGANQPPPQPLPYLASQRDVAPTLLDLLNIPIPAHMSGRSLLHPQDSLPIHYADLYHNGELWWSTGRRLYQIPLQQPHLARCSVTPPTPMPPPTTEPCSKADRLAISAALAFTHVSQQRLFDGRILAPRTSTMPLEPAVTH